MEGLNITDEEINFRLINCYNIRKDKSIETNDTLTMPISRFKRIFNIVHQTDSYKNALDVFLLNIDAKKYNI
jgi:hypothetical protein